MEYCAICRDEIYGGPHLGCLRAREADHADALLIDKHRARVVPAVIAEDDSTTRLWVFPRGTKDREIARTLYVCGWAVGGWDCRCGDGDCCGATFSNGLDIVQNRKAKRVYLTSARCC